MNNLHRLHHALTAALPHAGARQLSGGATAEELQLEAAYTRAVERPIRSTYTFALTGISEVEDEDEGTIAAWIRNRFDGDPAATAALAGVLYQYGRRGFELGGRFGLQAMGVTASFSLSNPGILDALRAYAEGLADPYADVSLTNTTAVETARRFARQREEGLTAGDIVGGFGPFVAGRALARSTLTAETESVRVSRQGMLETFSRNEVQEFVYLTAGDDRVCVICEPYHLRRYSAATYRMIYGLIPQHVLCRCYWEPALEGWELPEEVWTGG